MDVYETEIVEFLLIIKVTIIEEQFAIILLSKLSSIAWVLEKLDWMFTKQE